MRAHEFIFEYKRDITANNYGDKLIIALAKTPGHMIPDDLYNIYTVIDMTMYPNKYNTYNSYVTFYGDQVELNKDDAKEIFQKYKPQFITSILRCIEYKDPTNNKQYTQWLARMYANGTINIEDMNRNSLLYLYDLGKKRRMIPAEYADINKFKSYKDFESTMNTKIDINAIEASDQPTDKGDSETVYEDSDVRVIVPKNEAAACYYGQGTQWCTAATRGDNMFDRYKRYGDIYILLPKHPAYTGEKYQFQPGSGQYMNEQDTSVDFVELMLTRFTGFLDYFRNSNVDVKSMLALMPDDELETVTNKINKKLETYTNQFINISHELNFTNGTEIIRRVMSQILSSSPQKIRSEIKDMHGNFFNNVDIFSLLSFYITYINESLDTRNGQYSEITEFINMIDNKLSNFKIVSTEDGKWDIVPR